MEINKEARRKITQRLNEYTDFGRMLTEIEEELSTTPADENSTIKSKYKISRSTENFVIKLEMNKQYQELRAWKKLLDNLFIEYDKKSLKWQFIQRRYILQDTLYYKIPHYREIKDVDVFRDFELEGHTYCERTYKRLKEEIIADIYKEAIKINIF